MSRKQGRIGPPGFVVIDKPVGATSFEVVRRVRDITDYRRVGHGGTLDPFATGVLVLGLGAATRLLQFLSAGEKTYTAEIRFGIATDSGDLTGDIVEEIPCDLAGIDWDSLLGEFVGTISQVPPRLSAIKVDGKRSYDRARAGEAFELAAREVEVHSIELLGTGEETATIRVRCGGGTYIRSLACDIGRRAGTCAHVVSLRREQVGPFGVEQACDYEKMAEVWKSGPQMLPIESLTGGWPCVELTEEEVHRVQRGQQPSADWWDREGREISEDFEALFDPQGSLVAVVRAEPDENAKLIWVRPKSDDSTAE